MTIDDAGTLTLDTWKDAWLYELGIRAIPDTVITTDLFRNAPFRLAY